MFAHHDFNFDNIVICKASKNHRHIYKNPKVLPCGCTFCFDCIKSVTSNDCCIQCFNSKCNRISKIDLTNLISNSVIECTIDENLSFLANSLKEKIKFNFNLVKSKIY